MTVSNTIENIMDILKTIYFADVADMVVLTLLIYKLFRLVRESRAGQLVKGIIVFLALYAFVNVIDMRATEQIMRYIVNYGIICLVIIFQPEIRKFLETVGRAKYIRKFLGFAFVGSQNDNDDATVTMIETVCDACSELSRTKTGAILVFERETNLNEFIKTGTIVDGKVTSELIENIFFVNTPLHDGAVIVRNNRIYAAGCFLPLSDNYEIKKTLGTRHRASLGISEQSDAFVVIISEETGSISYAFSGKLHYHISSAELYTEMKSLFVENSNSNGKRVFRKAEENEKI